MSAHSGIRLLQVGEVEVQVGGSKNPRGSIPGQGLMLKHKLDKALESQHRSGDHLPQWFLLRTEPGVPASPVTCGPQTAKRSSREGGNRTQAGKGQPGQDGAVTNVASGASWLCSPYNSKVGQVGAFVARDLRGWVTLGM